MRIVDLVKIYKERNFSYREIKGIVLFVNKYEGVFGERYHKRIINRLAELNRIRYQFDDTKHIARSLKNEIVFFKNIKNDDDFFIYLQHELFHFIQKEGSLFEHVPEVYRDRWPENCNILLWEEAFVQYFTSVINDKRPEFTFIENGEIKRYWLNECYKSSVGYIEKLEYKFGIQTLMDMYMDDNVYLKIIDLCEKWNKRYLFKIMTKVCEKSAKDGVVS